MPAVLALSRQRFLWAALLAMAAAPASASAPRESRYRLDFSQAASGRIGVELETVCAAAPCELQLPVWSAVYQVRDFVQHVARLEAEVPARGPAAVRKIGPSRWRVEAPEGSPIRVRYTVIADRPGPFGAYADSALATLNLAQILLFPDALRAEPFSIEFDGKPARWREAVELPGYGRGYRAGSYDLLVDTPVLLGEFAEISFETGGKRVRIVAADAPGPLTTLESTVRRIVAAAERLMGELPFDSYTFVYVFSDEDGGGMEFRNGSFIFAPSDCRDCGLASLTAHEFFHLWNVKRIRPSSMEPVDFSRPNPSPSLWFAEGVTSAYAQYLLLAAGLQSPGGFLRHLERLIAEYESRPASRTQPATEASIDAWLERYPAYGRADRSVSYYLKGELIGHALDLEIRRSSGNRHSLDDVLRRLDSDYGRQGRFFDDDRTLEALCSEYAGRDLGPLFDTLVREAAPIPWAPILEAAGLRLETATLPRPDLGMTLVSPPGQGVVVAEVFPDGAAERAGLRADDRVLRIDGRRVTGGAYEIQKRIEKAVGRDVEFVVERRGGQRTAKLRPVETEQRSFRIVEIPDATSEQVAVRRGWLTRTSNPAPAASSTE